MYLYFTKQDVCRMSQSVYVRECLEVFGQQTRIYDCKIVSAKVSLLTFKYEFLYSSKSETFLKRYVIFSLLFKGCDCLEEGTQYCSKESDDYCQCKPGYMGRKCNEPNYYGTIVEKEIERKDNVESDNNYLFLDHY